MKSNVHFSNYIRSFLVKIRNVSVRSCRENQITYCVQSLSSFENRAILENVENIVERGRPRDNTADAHCMLHTQVDKNDPLNTTQFTVFLNLTL
jgi:hypothetical protein